jgi:hypothetical protein
MEQQKCGFSLLYFLDKCRVLHHNAGGSVYSGGGAAG